MNKLLTLPLRANGARGAKPLILLRSCMLGGGVHRREHAFILKHLFIYYRSIVSIIYFIFFC